MEISLKSLQLNLTTKKSKMVIFSPVYIVSTVNYFYLANRDSNE